MPLPPSVFAFLTKHDLNYCSLCTVKEIHQRDRSVTGAEIIIRGYRGGTTSFPIDPYGTSKFTFSGPISVEHFKRHFVIKKKKVVLFGLPFSRTSSIAWIVRAFTAGTFYHHILLTSQLLFSSNRWQRNDTLLQTFLPSTVPPDEVRVLTQMVKNVFQFAFCLYRLRA